jgi:hypothetical protein
MPRSLKTQLYVIKSDKTAIPPFTYCIRKPVTDLSKITISNYKKGYEVRISINDIEEVKILKDILRKKHITFGNPYNKHKRTILPIYGKENTSAFANIIAKAL